MNRFILADVQERKLEAQPRVIWRKESILKALVDYLGTTDACLSPCGGDDMMGRSGHTDMLAQPTSQRRGLRIAVLH